jgi:hypothetical protein
LFYLPTHEQRPNSFTESLPAIVSTLDAADDGMGGGPIKIDKILAQR